MKFLKIGVYLIFSVILLFWMSQHVNDKKEPISATFNFPKSDSSNPAFILIRSNNPEEQKPDDKLKELIDELINKESQIQIHNHLPKSEVQEINLNIKPPIPIKNIPDPISDLILLEQYKKIDSLKAAILKLSSHSSPINYDSLSKVIRKNVIQELSTSYDLQKLRDTLKLDRFYDIQEKGRLKYIFRRK